MIPDEYAVVWFDGNDIFTLVDADGKPVILNYTEVEYDLKGAILDRNIAHIAREAGKPENRYGITLTDLEKFFGIYL